MAIEKDKCLLAYKNGLLELYRGDEISQRITEEHPFSEQIALLMDKDFKVGEWNAYQAFRSKIKAEVDAEIEAIIKEYTNEA